MEKMSQIPPSALTDNMLNPLRTKEPTHADFVPYFEKGYLFAKKFGIPPVITAIKFHFDANGEPINSKETFLRALKNLSRLDTDELETLYEIGLMVYRGIEDVTPLSMRVWEINPS